MNKKMEQELQQWFSTYGVLTADRILERFKIHLDHSELKSAIHNPKNIYYQWLRAPLKNVFNGIVLQQVYDYQVFAQKLFVDYLISGNADVPDDAPGQSIRKKLESEREKLAELNDKFGHLQSEHEKNITQSQVKLIESAGVLKSKLVNVVSQLRLSLEPTKSKLTDKEIQKAVRESLIIQNEDESVVFAERKSFWQQLENSLGVDVKINDDLIDALEQLQTHQEQTKVLLSGFLDNADTLILTLREIRKQFYQLILTVKELIYSLPDFRRDEEKETEQLEALQFDANIGEK